MAAIKDNELELCLRRYFSLELWWVVLFLCKYSKTAMSKCTQGLCCATVVDQWNGYLW